MIPVSMMFRATLAGFCAAGLGALVPAAAQADQYIVDHCQTPAGQPAAVFGTITGQTSNDCSSPGGGLHHQEGTSSLPNSGSNVQIVLSIPADRPNLQIERVISTFSMPGAPPPPPAGGNGYAFLSMYDGNHTLIYNALAPTTPTRAVVDQALTQGDRALTWETLCAGTGCSFFEQNILNVFGTRLYLNESVAPTLAVTGGTLVATGPKRGSLSLAFDLHDTDSGVSSVAVTLGGVAVGSVKYTCASTDWSACPRDETGQLLTIDTTKVPDGDQELVVTVRDAANNAPTRSLGTVTVANGPASLPNGANPSRLAKVAARFTTTSKRSRTVRFTAGATVRGALHDEQGQSITGATIAILARPRQSGATATQIATAQTGADGGFSAKLPSGPSRTVTFAYTAFSTDARPATTATLKTNVRAVVSARIAPRSSRPGGRITLTGKLKLLPRKGVEVTIQARQGRTWRTIDDVGTTRTGSFRWRYRFAANQARRTYAFRVRVASQNYPFAATSSKPIFVRVR